MMQRVHVLLPVHNRRTVTERFIDCLVAQTYTDYSLVLIDDGSTDGTAEMVRAKIPDATVLRGCGDWWWAGSLQQGINWLERHEVAGPDIILFANDDITFEPDFMRRAVEILDSNEATLLLPYLRDEKTGVPQESGVDANLRLLTFTTASSPDKINCLPTRGLFMRMVDLRKVGNFYPRVLPHYLSDYEYTMRARKKGLKLLTSAEIAVRLDREQTGYRDMKSIGCIGFLRRLFSKKNVSNPIFWSTFILLIAPKPYIPGHLFKVWTAALRSLFCQCTNGLRKQLREAR